MSDHVTVSDVWLVGAGPMAIEYARVLDGQGVRFEVIGRGEDSARAFRDKTGHAVTVGGLKAFIASGPKPPTAAIVATGVLDLAPTALTLLAAGVRRILVEKPAALDGEELGALESAAQKHRASVMVGYNRRSYASTRRAREIIAEDGGVVSFVFEFTEWSKQVVAHAAPPAVKARWLLANSSHVIDLAFHLGGKPATLSSYVAGGLPWHPHAAVFAGAGVSVTGALFSYHANWDGPGRWGVEVLTRQRRLIFRPLEKLQVQARETVVAVEEPIDDALDRQFKPGLYRQVEAFLGGESGIIPDLSEQREALRYYDEINGGVNRR
jgi:predicted dehydrogenase